MTRVTVKPELLRWAYERAGHTARTLAERFPRLGEWERGAEQPTLKQLEAFAHATHTPIGYFFLPTPPVESIPIPDFRTPRNEFIQQPTPDLLDTIYLCQQRQEWYRDFARSTGEPPLTFVGSATTRNSVLNTAATIREGLGLTVGQRQKISTRTDALRQLIDRVDAIGVLVMVNGVVGTNNHRPLDPHEFRGFALADDRAPLIFVNGADTKAAQMFTLAHELAHIWLGKTALDDAQAATLPDQGVERWCNEVAAELLVPLEAVEREFDSDQPLRDEVDRLARVFKVSTLVVIRRIHDAGKITKAHMWAEYREEAKRLKALPKGSGGNFYATQTARVGKRFARAVIGSTLEGQTLHRDAFRMLGVSKVETFHKWGESLGVT